MVRTIKANVMFDKHYKSNQAKYSQHLYVLRAYQGGIKTNILKVGVTNTPQARLRQHNQAWAHLKVEWKYEYLSEVDNTLAKPAEKLLHARLERFGVRRKAINKVEGATELYFDTGGLVFSEVRKSAVENFLDGGACSQL